MGRRVCIEPHCLYRGVIYLLSQGCYSKVQDQLKASELQKRSVCSPKHGNVRDEDYDGLHANRKTQF